MFVGEGQSMFGRTTITGTQLKQGAALWLVHDKGTAKLDVHLNDLKKATRCV
jgi:hypothetical protein